jgi:hypothetical protein
MKPKAIIATAINIASGLFEEITVNGEEKTLTYRLSPYGEFPATDVSGKPIIQVVDKDTGNYMAQNFQSLAGKMATFFRGIPIYEGHADDPDWADKNPGHKAAAVGRIKSMENREDGIYVTSVLNSAGVEMLSGEAPRYSGHSPHWRMAEIPARPGHYRPVLLWSDALTNSPRIPANTIALNALQGMPELSPDADPLLDSADAEKPKEEININMKLHPDALKALGFADGAEPTPEDISAAILKLASGKETEKAKEVMKSENTDAVNSAAVTRAIDIVLDDAIATGRITAAHRPAWATALNTSFESEHAKLQSLMPVLNTTNHVTGQTARQPGQVDATNTVEAITDGARAYAVKNNIDITTNEGWNRAFQGFKAANPALFAK